MWIVSKNGRRVFADVDVERCFGYVADRTAHTRETVAEETRNGQSFVDDAQDTWTIEERT